MHPDTATTWLERGLQSAAILEIGVAERFALAHRVTRTRLRTEVRAPARSVPARQIAAASTLHCPNYGALTRTRIKRCGAEPNGEFSRTTMVSVFVPVRLTSVVSGVLGTAPVTE